jgi:S1-C subfamily serine protease
MIKRILVWMVILFLFFGSIILTIRVTKLENNLTTISDILQSDYDDTTTQLNERFNNEVILSTAIQDLERKVNKNNINENNKLNELAKNSSTVDDLIIKSLEEISNETDILRLLKTDVFVGSLWGVGGGTVIKKTNNNMYIITCAHVVAEIKKLNEQGFQMGATVGYYKNDDKYSITGIIAYGAEIIKYDEDMDLALLKTSAVDDDLLVAKLAKVEPEKGDIVYSIGTPLGFSRTISKGILSNKVDGLYISDGTITFGNSGGGLYNERGELIGVPQQVFGYEVPGGGVPESGLGFSIPLSDIKEFLKDTEVKDIL